MKKIYIAGDHAGFKLKESLKKSLAGEYELMDLGAHKLDRLDDYPDFAVKLARKVSSTKERGILICGSSQGVCIAANRIKGIRAASCWNLEAAKLSKQHLDANIICLGARIVSNKLAEKMVKTWIKTKFLKGRHLRRINKIK